MSRITNHNNILCIVRISCDVRWQPLCDEMDPRYSVAGVQNIGNGGFHGNVEDDKEMEKKKEEWGINLSSCEEERLCAQWGPCVKQQ